MDDQDDYGLIKYEETFTRSDDHDGSDRMDQDQYSDASSTITSSSSSSSTDSSLNQKRKSIAKQQWMVKGNRIVVQKLRHHHERLVEQCFDIPLHESMHNCQQTMMFISQMIFFRHPTSLWHRCTEWEQHAAHMPEDTYGLWYNLDTMISNNTSKLSMSINAPVAMQKPWCDQWRHDLKQSLQLHMHPYHVDQVFHWYANDDVLVQRVLQKHMPDRHQTYMLQWIRDLLVKFTPDDRFNVYHLLITLLIWLTHPWTLGILRPKTSKRIVKLHVSESTQETRSNQQDMSNTMLNQFWSAWFDPCTKDHLRNSIMIDMSSNMLSHYLLILTCLQTHANQLGIHHVKWDTSIQAHVQSSMDSKTIKKLRFQVFVNSIINQMIIPLSRQFVMYRCHHDTEAHQMHAEMTKMMDMLSSSDRVALPTMNLQKIRYIGRAWNKTLKLNSHTKECTTSSSTSMLLR